MKRQQAGFTLIELIVVIVILGILAATAMPKFVDLKGEASLAAAKGVAGGLGSASAINSAGCSATGNVAKANVCTVMSAATAKCSAFGALMNPAIVFTIGAIPATTVEGTVYQAAEVALTTAGATCTFTYGDGGAGQVVSFTGFATGA